MDKNIEYWIGVVREKPNDQLGCLKIYNKYRAFVTSILVKMLKMPDVADELTSIVFMKVYNKLTLYESHTSFKAWIHRLTVNTAIDFIRSKQRNQNTISTDEVLCYLEILSEDPDPSEIMELKELRTKINNILDSMDSKFKEILILRFIQGMDYESISKKLSIPIGTVKSRLCNARKLFKQSY